MLLRPGGRLNGLEGSGQVVQSLKPPKRTQMLLRSAASIALQKAEQLVPMRGEKIPQAINFDIVSHAALPMNLSIEASTMEPILRDAKRSVAVLWRVEQLHQEIRDLDDDDDPNTTWADAFQHARTAKETANMVKGLRNANDKAAHICLETLRNSTGPELVDALLRSKIKNVQEHHESLKQSRRKTLDETRKQRVEARDNVPLERRQLKREQQLQQEELAEARVKLKNLEVARAEIETESREPLFKTQRRQIEARRRLTEMERALVRAESELELEYSEKDRRSETTASLPRSVSPSLNQSDAQASADVSLPGETKLEHRCRQLTIKTQLLRDEMLDAERQHNELQKNVQLRISQCGVQEQDALIKMMEKEHIRAVDANRKARKKLDEKLPILEDAIKELDIKRADVEIAFRKEILENLEFDRERTERTLESSLLDRLRCTGIAGLRRYSAGQQLVVLVHDTVASKSKWCDATVKSASAMSFAHTLQLGDGSQVTQILQPFNHSIRRLQTADWETKRAHYAHTQMGAHSSSIDNLTGERSDVLAHCLDFVGEDGKNCNVHSLSQLIQSSYATASRSITGIVPEATCALLLGQPAAGKSTAMRQMMMLNLKRQDLVPIFVRVADLQRFLEDPECKPRFEAAWNWIDAYLQCVYSSNSNGDVQTYAMLRQALMARRALLLLDGIDEGGNKSSAVERHILEVLRPQGHAILATARPQVADKDWPQGVMKVYLRPLSASQQQTMMCECLGSGPHGTGLLKYLRELVQRNGISSVSNLVDNPLMLRTVISIYDEHVSADETSDEEKVVEMPLNLADLYFWATEAMLKRTPFSYNAALYARELLGVAAFFAHCNKIRTISSAGLNTAARTMRPELQNLATVLPDELRAAIKEIKELVLRDACPLLSLLRAKPFECQFTHLSLQEYLFAVTATKGATMPTGTERPWQWSSWFANALRFGIAAGDSFGNGLLRGTTAESNSRDHLNLDKAVGFYPSAGRPPVMHAMGDSEAREPEVLPDPSINRKIPILAVQQLISHCSKLNLQKNHLSSAEIEELFKGIRPSVLRSLNLNFNRIGDKGIKTIASIFSSAGSQSKLRELEVTENGFGFAGTIALAQLVSASTTLVLLDIRGNDPTDDGLRALGRAQLQSDYSALSNLRSDAFDLSPGMKELSLSPFIDAAPSLVLLAGLLKHDDEYDTLEQVNVYNAKVGVEGGTAFAYAMRTNRKMTRLSFSNAQLGDDGLTALSPGFKSHDTLAVLELDSCGFTQRGAKALSSNLRGGCRALRHLSLQGNCLRDPGVISVAEACSSLKCLKALNVSAASFGSPGFKAIAKHIEKSNSLVFLDVTTNDLQGEGIRAMGYAILKNKASVLRVVLCDAFAMTDGITTLRLRNRSLVAGTAPLLSGLMLRNCTLVTLDLKSNGLGPTGAEALAEGIAQSRTLRHLNLAHNYIRPKGLQALAHAIHLNKGLTDLDLSDNQACGVVDEGTGTYTTVGVKALAEAVGHSRLESIDLSNNRLEVRGAKVFAPALRSCRSLRQISLSGNNLTFFGLDSSGVNEVLCCAKQGSPVEVNFPAEQRVIDLSDNHMNLHGMAVKMRYQPIRPPGSSTFDFATMRIVCKRCECYHCRKQDELPNASPVAKLADSRRGATSHEANKPFKSLREQANSVLKGIPMAIIPPRLHSADVAQRVKIMQMNRDNP